jgi:hypothetical protein
VCELSQSGKAIVDVLSGRLDHQRAGELPGAASPQAATRLASSVACSTG